MKVFQVLLAAVSLSLVLAGSSRQVVPVEPRMSLPGITCAVCTVITGLVDQLAEVHSEKYSPAFQRLCTALPKPYNDLCQAFRLFFGSQITRLLGKGETPDTACISMKLCQEPDEGQPMCHLYPSKLAQRGPADVRAHIKQLREEIPGLDNINVDAKLDPCSIPLIGNLVCSYLNAHAFSIELPEEDDDKDGFSDQQTLRGSSWRGKDCNDKSKTTYPGRKPALNDVVADTNCNGISGSDPVAEKTYEEILCANTGSMGLIALGDSVTANFHVPSEWFNATVLSKELFANLTFLMENSLNWPQTSLYTGYENISWPIIHGTTDSIYLKLRERNLCNHRDYQNIGVNGATIVEAEGFTKTTKRDINDDKPALVIFSYIGNDVCKYEHGIQGDVTTPAQARKGFLDTMKVLDKKLPPNSHVIVVAVADARIFYDGLFDKVHPFGSVRNDVTYQDFYHYLDCLDITPCRGWLNKDEAIRNITAQRTVEINAALEQAVIENSRTFNNFDMVYFPNPVSEVVETWIAQGGQSWELVEAFDGFHPNQKAHKLVADVVWRRIERDHPHLIGEVNPNNDRIRQLFGNQGGH